MAPTRSELWTALATSPGGPGGTDKSHTGIIVAVVFFAVVIGVAVVTLVLKRRR